jgi:hypothetical protein
MLLLATLRNGFVLLLLVEFSFRVLGSDILLGGGLQAIV